MRSVEVVILFETDLEKPRILSVYTTLLMSDDYTHLVAQKEVRDLRGSVCEKNQRT